MARLPRCCPPGIPVHVVQRGHNRQICFASTHDFAAYAHFLKEASERFLVGIHAWVFMTNHIHLLATPGQAQAVSRMMQTLGRNYVRYYNDTYRRSGTLWEGRFKCCLVDSPNYLLQCQRYIELNPVRAGMAADPADYRWSSYRCNALGIASSMVNPHPEYLKLGNDPDARRQRYRELFREQVDNPLLEAIRDATNRNMALGTNRFKEEIEATLARRMHPARAGRPRVNPEIRL